MIDNEVRLVGEEEKQPRPAWQVWAARVGLVLFIVFVVYQYLWVLRGGL